MNYVLEDFTEESRARVMRDASELGKPGLASHVRDARRWAVDTTRDSYFFKGRGYREAMGYVLFYERQFFTVFVSNYASVQRNGYYDRLVSISGVDLADPIFDLIRLPLADAFDAYGCSGYGQEGRERQPFTNSITPIFCNARDMPGS